MEQTAISATAAAHSSPTVCSLLVDDQHQTTSRTSPRFQYKHRTEETRASVDTIISELSSYLYPDDELYSATSSSSISNSCQQQQHQHSSSTFRRNSLPVNLVYFSEEATMTQTASLATTTAAVSVVDDETTDQSTTSSNNLASTRVRVPKSKKRIVVRRLLETGKSVSNTSKPAQLPVASSSSSHASIDFKSIVNSYHCMVFTCLKKACGMEASSRDQMMAHLLNDHNEDVDKLDEKKFDKMARLSYKCLVPTTVAGDQSTTSSSSSSVTVCGKKLESLNKIANHARKDHVNYLGKNLSYFYMCSHPDCFWLFENDCDLKAHKLQHKLELDSNYTVEKKHICQYCNVKFARPSHLAAHVKLHDQTHAAVRIKCDLCEETMITQAQLLTHMNQRHKNAEKAYKCHYAGCGRSYTLKMYLAGHITKVHKKQEIKAHAATTTTTTAAAIATSILPSDNLVVKEQILFKCDKDSCQKTFRTRNNLRRHQKVHDKENKKSVKLLKCEQQNCPAEFVRRDILAAHQRVHTNGKIFKCDFPNCRSAFRHIGNLTTHRRLIHNGDQEPRSESTGKSVLKIDFKSCSKLIMSPPAPNVPGPTITSSNSSSSTSQERSKTIIRLTANLPPNSQYFNCNDCHLRFDTHEQLSLHVKTHLDINLVSQKLNVYLVENKEASSVLEPSESERSIDLSASSALMTTDQPKTDPTSYENVMSSFINEPSQLILEQQQQPPLLVRTDSLANNNENSLEVVNDDSQEDTAVTKPVSLPFAHRHHEHVIININSDDEEFSTCSVVLDNMSGSARTDYKFNHQYIEKYTMKRKLLAQSASCNNKRFKESGVDYHGGTSSSSSSTTSPAANSDQGSTAVADSSPFSSSSRSSPMPILTCI